MKNVNKEMIKNKVNELVFIENHKRYILRCDLEKLEEKVRKYVINYISRTNIQIVDYEINRKSRTRSVDEYDYGYISGYGISHFDMPVYAKLEYNDNGDLIYEDYTNLDEIIENEIIPNNIFKDNETNNYYIKLSIIIGYRFCEAEVKHVIEYLESKDIYVHGYSTLLDNEFNSYYSMMDYGIPICRNFDIDNINAKLIEYKNNPSRELRNEIVELNINLVKLVAGDVKCFTDVNVGDLEGYGYIGLIKAIEKYDVNSENTFSTYAYQAIKRTIVRGIAKYLGIDSNIFGKYFVAKMYVKNKLGKDVDDDILSSIDDIINYMVEYKGLESSKKDENKTRIMLMFCESLELFNEQEIDNDFLIQDNLLPFEISKNDINMVWDNYFMRLSEREQIILTKYYDLDGKGSLTLTEIGEIFGVTREAIRLNIKDCFSKLKRFRTYGKLEDVLADYEQYNYNPNMIVAYQNVKKK